MLVQTVLPTPKFAAKYGPNSTHSAIDARINRVYLMSLTQFYTHLYLYLPQCPVCNSFIKGYSYRIASLNE